MTISAKGEVLAPFQKCCAVTSLCRIRDFSCLLHAAHVETKDMNMVVSFTLVTATFMPNMKMWWLSKRAEQVVRLCRMRDLSCLVHAAHAETVDMNILVSFALVMATFLPKMKIWCLSKRAVQSIPYSKKICQKISNTCRLAWPKGVLRI